MSLEGVVTRLRNLRVYKCFRLPEKKNPEKVVFSLKNRVSGDAKSSSHYLGESENFDSSALHSSGEMLESKNRS